MEKKSYHVLSGDSWEVEAESAKKALEKFEAWAESGTCPCENEDCECIRFGEANTVLLDTNPEDPEA